MSLVEMMVCNGAECGRVIYPGAARYQAVHVGSDGKAGRTLHFHETCFTTREGNVAGTSGHANTPDGRVYGRGDPQ